MLLGKGLYHILRTIETRKKKKRLVNVLMSLLRQHSDHSSGLSQDFQHPFYLKSTWFHEIANPRPYGTRKDQINQWGNFTGVICYNATDSILLFYFFLYKRKPFSFLSQAVARDNLLGSVFGNENETFR